MPGWLSNGMTTIVPITVNGTTSVFPQGTYTNLSSATALIPVDTEAATGQSPQSVAATPFQIASAAAALINNTATSTVHTGTLNTTSGMMVTEALTTAAGSDYTFQIVNSLIVGATTAAPQVQMHSGTNTAGGIAVKSITNAAGTTTAVFTNNGSAAWNGTMLITFHT
jgi:hypothetical protein